MNRAHNEFATTANKLGKHARVDTLVRVRSSSAARTCGQHFPSHFSESRVCARPCALVHVYSACSQFARTSARTHEPNHALARAYTHTHGPSKAGPAPKALLDALLAFAADLGVGAAELGRRAAEMGLVPADGPPPRDLAAFQVRVVLQL